MKATERLTSPVSPSSVKIGLTGTPEEITSALTALTGSLNRNSELQLRVEHQGENESQGSAEFPESQSAASSTFYANSSLNCRDIDLITELHRKVMSGNTLEERALSISHLFSNIPKKSYSAAMQHLCWTWPLSVSLKCVRLACSSSSIDSINTNTSKRQHFTNWCHHHQVSPTAMLEIAESLSKSKDVRVLLREVILAIADYAQTSEQFLTNKVSIARLLTSNDQYSSFSIMSDSAAASQVDNSLGNKTKSMHSAGSRCSSHSKSESVSFPSVTKGKTVANTIASSFESNLVHTNTAFSSSNNRSTVGKGSFAIKRIPFIDSQSTSNSENYIRNRGDLTHTLGFYSSASHRTPILNNSSGDADGYRSNNGPVSSSASHKREEARMASMTPTRPIEKSSNVLDRLLHNSPASTNVDTPAHLHMMSDARNRGATLVVYQTGMGEPVIDESLTTYETDAEGNQIRVLVESVLQYETHEYRVPVQETVETVREVKVDNVVTIDKVVEVPQIEYVDKYVEVPVVETVQVKRPQRVVVDVPVEVTKTIRTPERRQVEQIRHYNVPEYVDVPRYIDRPRTVYKVTDENMPTLVAQVLDAKVEIDESKQATVDAIEYTPELIPVTVYIPSPVRGLISTAAVDHRMQYKAVNPDLIPPAQYNTMVKSINSGIIDEELLEPLFKMVNGKIPIFPAEHPSFYVPIDEAEYNEIIQTTSSYRLTSIAAH